MPYKTFNGEGKEMKLQDLQDKKSWCVSGSGFENDFIKKFSKLGLIINPEKQSNIYVPDLLNIHTRSLGDLKKQTTPFFTAKSKFGIDPQYAVAFNKKDYLRYSELYPGIEIYFWVVWETLSYEGYQNIKVVPMEGVWKLSYNSMLDAVKNAPLHVYNQRINDQCGNAKDSYVLDLSSKYFVREF